MKNDEDEKYTCICGCQQFEIIEDGINCIWCNTIWEYKMTLPLVFNQSVLPDPDTGVIYRKWRVGK